jgi:hypothetical protein
MKPLMMMAIGFLLLVTGLLLPFLMVLRFLESSFALAFSAHSFSLIGLLVALYGILSQVNWRTRGDQ